MSVSQLSPLSLCLQAYLEQAQELVINENILLQTLGEYMDSWTPMHTHNTHACTHKHVINILLAQISVCTRNLPSHLFCIVSGFEITVDHPHTHIVRTCQLVKGQCHLSKLTSATVVNY